MVEIIHQDPQHFGHKLSRWTLTALLTTCWWLACKSVSGLWRILRRWNLHYKRARGHLHSPDPDYLAKLRALLAILIKSVQEPERYVVLFEDEMGYHRQPSLASAYETSGHSQPLAELGHRSNLEFHIGACLHFLTGRVHYRQRSHLGVAELTAFYQEVASCYPHAEVIYIIQDNWPVHFHCDLLAALMPQELPWPVHKPSNWPEEPSPKTKRLNLPIRLVQLPTYAPWTNPIEKLWRNLRQELLHLHRYKDNWDGLKSAVANYLDQFAQGCEELLRYVGLSDPTALYRTALEVDEMKCTNASN
jgi:hypothetical protein